MKMTHWHTSLLTLALLLALPATAAARGGLYFGFDLGGAKVWGDTNIVLNHSPDSQYYVPTGHEAQVRSETGSGFAAGIRLGYNVMGYAGIEATILAHGNKQSAANTWEGAGHPAITLRLYPMEFLTLFDNPTLKSFKGRPWDVNLSFGYAPYDLGGYHISSSQGRGWEGYSLQWGIAGEYYVAKTVSVGAEMRFIKPVYNSFLVKWDPWQAVALADTESNFVLAPMAQITFYLLDPHE
jgi:hypothetical protein